MLDRDPRRGTGTRGFGFPRRRRLRRGSEIRALLNSGRRVRGGSLEVITAPRESGEARFGTIVPLYGGTAARRNLMKRRLREVGRQEVLPRLDRAHKGVDFLVRIRPGAYRLSFGSLRGTLIRITEQLCSDQ
ncbi:MAG: ribonuclease P protein component [Gemmatimonadales bacterium]|nr:MAG: ribonuclease P protein component [Gemmatimonadales bacterium]